MSDAEMPSYCNLAIMPRGASELPAPSPDEPKVASRAAVVI
ncbi:hypothetical protein V4R08_07275 [Nitrobacter sp. NHB1]